MLWPDGDKENDVQRAGATRRTVSSPYLSFSQTSKLLIKWGFPLFLRFPWSPLLVALAAAFSVSFRSRAALQFEIPALRHQLGVLQRSVKRPKPTTADRFLWAWLSAAWADWQPSSIINQPGHGDRLASQGLRPVLDLEDSARKAGATGGPGGCPIFDWYDEPGQPALGRTADSRRTAQAWHCRRRNEREQVHGPQPSAASAWIT